MHLKFRNVNDAFNDIVAGIDDGHIPTERSTSRNGEVMYIQEPVIITYTHPKERVLFNKGRDANPFFHLYESLWMLAGRNDVAPLAYYVNNMTSFSDDGKTLNGAYGYRWRHAVSTSAEYLDNNETDQLTILIEHLRHVPDSRRAVLQMWNVQDDLLKIGNIGPCLAEPPCRPCPECGGRGRVPQQFDGPMCISEWPLEVCKCCGGAGVQETCCPRHKVSKDVCCNLSVLFAIRPDYWQGMSEAEKAYSPNQRTKYLDMTVFNRSNDLIWGTLGANVVHFSMLQEYMACALGVEVGYYHQVSNNQHVYLSNWNPLEWQTTVDELDKVYPVSRIPLVKNRAQFDMEVKYIAANSWPCANGLELLIASYNLTEPYLGSVAKPMFLAFNAHKQRNYDKALYYLDQVKAPDWKLAGTQWIQKRLDGWRKKKPD